MGKKTKQDPTGQAVNRRRGARALDLRLSRAERRVKGLFRAVPRSSRREVIIRNAESLTIYDYNLTPDEQKRFDDQVVAIVNDELTQTQNEQIPFNWFWLPIVELAFRQGTGEELVQFNRLITQEVTRRTVRNIPVPFAVQPLDALTVLRSPEYLNALNSTNVQNFNTISSLSNRTSAQVIQEINLGTSAGETPKQIAERITKRFNVSKSSAKRIADTEINRAYNDARINAVDIAANQTGLRSGVIHISALIPTTRPNHAARHGNAYTTTQQQQWWNTGSNRINCHCTTRTVLIDRNGQLFDTELQEDIKAERSFFDQ